MMDSTSRAVAGHIKQTTGPVRVTDATGDAGLGLCRPGFRKFDGGNEGDAILRRGEARDRAEVYQDWERDATNAWRDAAKTDDAVSDIKDKANDAAVSDIKDKANDAADAYSAYEDEMAEAWKRGNK
jgi:hypothetical protein